MKFVYRIEHKTVKQCKDFPVFASPYQSPEIFSRKIVDFDYYSYRSLQDKLHKNHARSVKNNHRPNPQADGFVNMYDDHFCGCPSLKKVRVWFDCIVKDVFKHGFVIRRYVVKDRVVTNSKLQCIFHKNDIISSEIMYEKKKRKKVVKDLVV